MKKIFLLFLICLLLSPVILADEKPDYEYGKVSFKKHFDSSKAMGKITNNTSKSDNRAFFLITVYNENKEIINTATIIIPNFTAHSTKTFDCYITDTLPSEIHYYSIQYDD